VTLPTWTCAPYQTEWRPRFGQQIAWGESNAIIFANSVLGARTERYPDLLDICCAITGRVPAVGLHLTENRAGDLLLVIQDVPLSLQSNESFYPVLGHLIGKIAQDHIPVITGLGVTPSEDQLKALGAAQKGALGKVLWARSRETHGGPHSDWFWNKERSGGGAIFQFTLPLTGKPPEMEHPDG